MQQRNSIRKTFEESFNFVCCEVIQKEGFPFNGKKSVTVNVPSRLGSAMSIYPPRGQIWSAFFQVDDCHRLWQQTSVLYSHVADNAANSWIDLLIAEAEVIEAAKAPSAPKIKSAWWEDLMIFWMFELHFSWSKHQAGTSLIKMNFNTTFFSQIKKGTV